MKESSISNEIKSAMYEEEDWKNNLVECLKKSEEEVYKFRQEKNKL